MNTIINQIFKEIYGMTEESQNNDRELSGDVGSILELIRQNDNADIEDLIFQASGYGQQLGFIGGFKLAVKLMSECSSIGGVDYGFR